MRRQTVTTDQNGRLAWTYVRVPGPARVAGLRGREVVHRDTKTGDRRGRKVGAAGAER